MRHPGYASPVHLIMVMMMIMMMIMMTIGSTLMMLIMNMIMTKNTLMMMVIGITLLKLCGRNLRSSINMELVLNKEESFYPSYL